MKETILKIEGMSCGMCESHINTVVRSTFPVKSVKSSCKKGETVIVSEEAPEENELRSAIEATGYSVLSYTCTDYRKKGLFGR